MQIASRDHKSHRNDESKFQLEISILNALSYLVIALSVTYVDSHIHHISHGLRNYPMGYSVWWISIPIFLLTFIINSNADRKLFYSAESKAVLTFLIVVVTNVILNYVCFPPEFPHSIMVFGSIMYEAILAFLVYFHKFELNFTFVRNNDVDKIAKIERIKLDYDIWKNFFFVLIAGFSGWILVWLQGVKYVGEMVTKIPAEQEIVRTHIIFLILIGSFFGFLLLCEVVKKILIIRNQLDNIER